MKLHTLFSYSMVLLNAETGLRNFHDSSPVNNAIQRVLNDDRLSLYDRQLLVERIVLSSWQELFGLDKKKSPEGRYYKYMSVFFKQYNGVLDAALINIKGKGRSEMSSKIGKYLIIGRANLVGIVFKVIFRILNRGEKALYTNICCEIGNNVIKFYHVQRYLAIDEAIRPKWNDFVIESSKDYSNSDEITIAAGIGTLLVDVCLNSGELIERIVIRESKDNTTVWLSPSSEAISMFKDEVCYIGTRLPMIVMPVKWESDESFGGYLSNRTKEFKYLIHQQSQTDSVKYIKYWTKVENKELIYGMVNNMQSVGFRINKKVLEWLINKGESTGVLVRAEEAEKSYKIEKNSDIYIKYCLQRNILGIAKTYAKFERLYIPLYLDWRGRLYAETEYLSFQGCALAKALLEFSDGGVLVKDSNCTEDEYSPLRYFKIYGANCYGIGNKSFDERVKWCDEHHEKIIEASDEFILSADEPLLFVAFCLEYKSMIERWYCGNDYTTHLPIQLDASCNGIQHLTCIIADTKLAKRVNIIESSTDEDPHDLYSECVGFVSDAILKKIDDYPIYQHLVGLKIDRSLIKRSIMTIPYNVTPNGIMNQLENSFIKKWNVIMQCYDYTPVKPECNGYVTLRSVDLMCVATIIHQTLYKEHPKLKIFVTYCDEIVKILTKLNLPVIWLTPSGLKINQHYKAVKSYKFKSGLYVKSKTITLQIPTDKLDSKRQRSGITPNLIHSLDASVIALVSQAFIKKNIKSYFTIHDCFAATADKIPLMTVLVREAFIGIYADNKYIKNLHELLLNYIEKHFDVSLNDGEKSVFFDGEYIIIPEPPLFDDKELPLWSRFPAIIRKAIYMIH